MRFILQKKHGLTALWIVLLLSGSACDGCSDVPPSHAVDAQLQADAGAADGARLDIGEAADASLDAALDDAAPSDLAAADITPSADAFDLDAAVGDAEDNADALSTGDAGAFADVAVAGDGAFGADAGENDAGEIDAALMLDAGREDAYQPSCGDGLCEMYEDALDCSADCSCGDGFCDERESWMSCPQDCEFCGNGNCGGGEDETSCAQDCSRCGDGVCGLGEDDTSCAQDCTSCSTAQISGSSDFYYISATATANHVPLPASCGLDGNDVGMSFEPLGRMVYLESSGYGDGAIVSAYHGTCVDGDFLGCGAAAAPYSPSRLLLLDQPREPYRFVLDNPNNDDLEMTLTVVAYYAPGEACIPGPSMHKCAYGQCQPSATDAQLGVCPALQDCPDGIDNDDDGRIDEAPCDNDFTLYGCQDIVDGRVGESVQFHVRPVGNINFNTKLRMIDKPADSHDARLSENLIPGNPQYFVPDVWGFYTIRATVTLATGQQKSCDMRVNVETYDCLDGIDNDDDGVVDEDSAVCPPSSRLVCPPDRLVFNYQAQQIHVDAYHRFVGADIDWRIIDSPLHAQVSLDQVDNQTRILHFDRPGAYVVRSQAHMNDSSGLYACDSRIFVALYDCPDGIDNDGDGEIDEDTASCHDAQSLSCSPDAVVEIPGSGTCDTSTSASVTGPQQGDALRAFWSVLQAPEPRKTKPTASALEQCDATGCTQPTQMTINLAGAYALRYTTVDLQGHVVACEQNISTHIPDDLHIELTWNLDMPVPEDTSDVDLHLLHPDATAWFDTRNELDCYYMTCICTPDQASCTYPDWEGDGAPGNDPRLDVDDTEGHGPENINLKTPVPGHVYTVGLHLFDLDTNLAAVSNVSIYCGGQIAASYGPQSLPIEIPDPDNVGGPMLSGRFWKIAQVVFDAQGQCSVTTINEIVTKNQAESGR